MFGGWDKETKVHRVQRVRNVPTRFGSWFCSLLMFSICKRQAVTVPAFRDHCEISLTWCGVVGLVQGKHSTHVGSYQ